MEIDIDKLKHYCSMPIDDFRSLGTIANDYPDLLIYQDNKSSILGVAHLDSVMPYKRFIHDKKKNIVKCATLDDRTGVYILLDLLPKYGIKLDILLTTNEESVNSSAICFDTTKHYNWIVEFDRKGNDVVCYQYETKRLRKMLRSSGFDNIGFGTYSDIRDLNHLGCLGFNVGVGYFNYHSKDAWLSLIMLQKQVAHFRMFYSKYRDTFLQYNHDTRHSKWYYPSNKSYWYSTSTLSENDKFGLNPKYDDLEPCSLCGINFIPQELNYVKNFGFLCPDCEWWVIKMKEDNPLPDDLNSNY